MNLIATLKGLYDVITHQVEKLADGFVLGLAARFTFLSVLYFYFINSASTKIGDGFFGFLSMSTGAYYQILPQVMSANGGNTDVGFFYQLVVYGGTYAEFILPTLIVLGLFTRLAALGMIGFVFVQSFVDINFHNAGAETIGNMFDRISESAILDQRLMWVFILLVLALKGAGALSLDSILNRFQKN